MVARGGQDRGGSESEENECLDRGRTWRALRGFPMCYRPQRSAQSGKMRLDRLDCDLDGVIWRACRMI